MNKQKNPDHIYVTVDTLTIVRVLGLVFAAIVAFILLEKIIQPLILVIVSFFLALALNPAVSSIAKQLPSRSRAAATAVAYVLVISVIVAFFSFVFPPLVKQTIDFVQSVPETVQNLKNDDTTLSRLVYKYHIDEEIDELTNDFGSRFSDLGKPALATAGKIGTTLISIVTVLVLTFMMLVEGPRWVNRYFAAINSRHREHHKKLALRMYRVVVGFVNGQVVIAMLGGVFASIALFICSQIFDVSINAIALGGIIALFALMPMIGTIIGAVIVVLACLLVSFPLAIAMTAYFIVYQQIENATIQPYIQSRNNTLSPLLVFIAAVLGVGLGGILGAILAIPIAGCIKVLIDDYFQQKRTKQAQTTT